MVLCGICLWLVAASCVAQPSGPGEPLVLTGHDLTVSDVVRVAREQLQVRADPAAMARVERCHRLLLLAAKQGLPIYG